MSREEIIERIKKLMRHSKSAEALGSIEEAEAFAKKATELLMEYNLEMIDILKDEANTENEFANWCYSEKVSYKDTQGGNRWKLTLMSHLTHANFSSYTYNRYFKTLRVYGRIQNVEVVVWMYNFITTSMLSIARQHYALLSDAEKIFYPKYRYFPDFLLGAANGIGAKLRAQRAEMTQSDNLHALMVLTEDALQRFVKIENPDIKEGRKAKKKFVGPGYSTGFEVGQNYSINKPLADAPEIQKRLN